MDKYTFGKSPCFVRVAEILIEIDDETITKRVSRILESFRSKINETLHLKHKYYFASLHTEYYVVAIQEKEDFSEILKSHLITCFRTIYKRAIS